MTINDLDQASVLEEPDRSPECRLTTPREVRNLTFFRVYLSVITPDPEESQNYLSLGESQAENELETISDQVELLDKQGRRDRSAR